MPSGDPGFTLRTSTHPPPTSEDRTRRAIDRTRRAIDRALGDDEDTDTDDGLATA